MKKYKVIYGVEKTLLAGAEHFITAESGSQAAEIAKKMSYDPKFIDSELKPIVMIKIHKIEEVV